ncbi:MAG: sigma-70 family RNA polymerase sigma factor [Candidatus Obscuribacterales bacterium]|nr:sigma-70 family RNA polymerase sigma factor [Cyanobacteria bacterium SZAS LIN-5]RTL46030.1 MAG: sigma-70 family RNA polymerase sigma factor [Candidatus Melainabacteria bacterium]
MFQTLVRRYQSRIFTASFRILSNAEEAEEVVQDTFLRVHQNISKFRKDASFSSWVFKIAHNQCMDILRNRQRKRGFRLLSFDPQSNKPEPTEDGMEAYTIVSQLTDPGADPSQSLELNEQGTMVIEALKRLTDTQRTVVVLHDIEGFQYQEIAEIVGTSIGTVRSRLHYGRVKLKELLEPYFSHHNLSAVSR